MPEPPGLIMLLPAAGPSGLLRPESRERREATEGAGSRWSSCRGSSPAPAPAWATRRPIPLFSLIRAGLHLFPRPPQDALARYTYISLSFMDIS